MTDVKPFVSPCPPPSPREREVIELLIEECAEVIHRATKALRFGLEEIQPGQDLENWQRLAREVGDVNEVVNLAKKCGIFTGSEIKAGEEHKRLQLAKYLQYRE